MRLRARATAAVALSVTLAAAAPARAGAATSAPPALSTTADALADALGPPAEGRRTLGLAVETRAPALQAPVEAALAAALAARGYTVVPLRGAADAEVAARAAGHDWLLRVQAGLVPGRRELALVGEAIPAWASFFLQRSPGARPVAPRLVQARAAADPETLLLGREARPAGAPFAIVRRVARVPGRALALAAGDVPERGAAILAVTGDAELLLSPAGAVLASRTPDLSGARPVRDPAAVAAVGDFGGGPLAVQRAGAARGEVLAVRGDRLEPVAALAAAPLCATEAGRLFGAFAPGTGLLADALSPFADPDLRPRSPRLLYGVAAAPRGGPIAYAALRTDLRLALLGPDLAPAGEPVAGVGSGFALADLDGDGLAEVVASDPAAAPPDRLRILAPRAAAPVLLEAAVDGLVLAGAAADLTGDGVDDAVLAALGRGEDGAPVTDVLLVTADPRELP